MRTNTAHLTRGELWVLTWLEDNGYPFHVYSDYDLDRGITGISQGGWRYKALILNTHPEYWTFSMKNKLKSYVEGGGSLIYLGGNGVYEHVTYERGGRSMRVLQEVPKAGLATGNQNAVRCVSLLRALRHPERAILGVGFENVGGLVSAPYEVDVPGHPLLNGVNSSTIGTDGLYCRASGWEMDVCGGTTPSNTTRLAHGTNALQAPYGADMVYRKVGPKNLVFSAGSLSFGASLVVDKNLQQVVENVLSAALRQSPPPSAPSEPAAQGPRAPRRRRGPIQRRRSAKRP